jgi:hypothetical protein
LVGENVNRTNDYGLRRRRTTWVSHFKDVALGARPDAKGDYILPVLSSIGRRDVIFHIFTR